MSNVFLFTSPVFRPLTAAGEIMPGAYLQFYASETTTPVDVYADAALQTSLGSLVTADAAGQFVPLYMDPSITYRVQLYDADDALVWDIDPYTPPRDYAPGTCLMFMGSAEQLEAAYPSALWQICDGTNGTYDMRGRIPVGVSDSIDPGEEVGSEPGTVNTDAAGAHTHGGNTGSTTLTESQIPAHRHFVSTDEQYTGSGPQPVTASNQLYMDTDGGPGGDTQYILRGTTAEDSTVGRSSATGGGTGHQHSIPEQAAHTHTVPLALPPCTGVWFVMRKFP